MGGESDAKGRDRGALLARRRSGAWERPQTSRRLAQAPDLRPLLLHVHEVVPRRRRACLLLALRIALRRLYRLYERSFRPPPARGQAREHTRLIWHAPSFFPTVLCASRSTRRRRCATCIFLTSGSRTTCADTTSTASACG